MSTSSHHSATSLRRTKSEKRVSFEDLTDRDLYKPEKIDPKDHKIQIEELFPDTRYRSILRRSLPELSERKQSAVKPKKKQVFAVDYSTPRRPHRLPPFKKPTEPLAHALLRSMSYKEPKRRTRLPTIDLVVKPEPEVIGLRRHEYIFESPRGKRKRQRDIVSDIPQRNINLRGRLSPMSQMSYKSKATSSRSNNSAPERIVFNSDMYDIVIKCGTCLRRNRTSPAAGFCRYCDEYLCSSCVYQHRGVLTRSHPVLVFNCDTCKEMNVLNRKDSGYCVHCKKYFCPICVISHCGVNNHDVLEGHDLLDIVYATVHRGFV